MINIVLYLQIINYVVHTMFHVSFHVIINICRFIELQNILSCSMLLSIFVDS